MTNLMDLLLRWIHILSAIALGGGLYFLWWVWVPAVAALPGEQRRAAQEVMRRRWAIVVMATTAILLASGLVNAVRIIKASDLPGLYHGLVAVKLLLALVVFWISAALAGRSSLAQRLQQQLPTWLCVNVLLVTAVVCLGGYLRQVRTASPPADVSWQANGAAVQSTHFTMSAQVRELDDGQESEEETR